MIFLAVALLGMVALVVCIVFMNFGGSSKTRMARRMEARAARLDYIRLARETDAANRARRAPVPADPVKALAAHKARRRKWQVTRPRPGASPLRGTRRGAR